MTFPIIPLAGVNLDGIEEKFTQLGLEVFDSDGCRRQLVQSGGPITQYDTLHITAAFVANPITHALAAQAGMIGNSPVSCSLTGQYFWAKMNGPATLRVAASCKNSVPLYTTDTAGVLDDATLSLTAWLIQGVMVNEGNSMSAGGAGSIAGTYQNPLVRNPKLAIV